MQVDINLASRQFIDFRPVERRLHVFTIALAALFPVLGTAVFLLHQSAQRLKSRSDALDVAISHTVAERNGYSATMREPSYIQMITETGYLNQVFDMKAFSWTLLIANLESVLPEDVILSQIEPLRSKDGSVTLRINIIGEKNHEIELLKTLEASQLFRLPRITAEVARATDSTGRSIGQTAEANSVTMEVLTEYLANSHVTRDYAVIDIPSHVTSTLLGSATSNAVLRTTKPPTASNRSNRHEPPSGGSR